jgi:hypothetical protein
VLVAPPAPEPLATPATPAPKAESAEFSREWEIEGDLLPVEGGLKNESGRLRMRRGTWRGRFESGLRTVSKRAWRSDSEFWSMRTTRLLLAPPAAPTSATSWLSAILCSPPGAPPNIVPGGSSPTGTRMHWHTRATPTPTEKEEEEVLGKSCRRCLRSASRLSSSSSSSAAAAAASSSFYSSSTSSSSSFSSSSSSSSSSFLFSLRSLLSPRLSRAPPSFSELPCAAAAAVAVVVDVVVVVVVIVVVAVTIVAASSAAPLAYAHTRSSGVRTQCRRTRSLPLVPFLHLSCLLSPFLSLYLRTRETRAQLSSDLSLSLSLSIYLSSCPSAWFSFSPSVDPSVFLGSSLGAGEKRQRRLRDRRSHWPCVYRDSSTCSRYFAPLLLFSRLLAPLLSRLLATPRHSSPLLFVVSARAFVRRWCRECATCSTLGGYVYT